MKLLFVTEFFPVNSALQFTGGVEAHNYYLFKELAKKHQVTVICRWGNGKVENKNWGMKIIRVGRKPSRIDTNYNTLPERFWFLVQSFKVGLKQDFDLVQGNNFVSFLSAFLLGWVKHKPAVAWYADVFIGNWINHTGFISGIVGEVMERITLILPWRYFISLSLSTTQKLINHKISSDKITTIYGGVDFNFFSKFKLKKNKIFTICCISRLVSYKRVDLLIKAASFLQSKEINFRLEIIGNGPEDFSLKLLTREYKLSDKVKFRTNVSRENLAKTLARSHLFCLPSEQEGFGLVVIEAANCKLPFIVSDLPVLKEVTNNGQGGLIFERGNAKDLAHKIEKVMKDKKLYRKLSQDSFTLAQKYKWSLIASEFSQTFQKIINPDKKVLMLIDAWFPHVGGGQIHVLELAKRLIKRGYEVEVLSRNLGTYKNDNPKLKVTLLGKKDNFAKLYGRLEYLFLALIYCLKYDYDIYHAHAFSPGLIMPFVKFFKKGKVVFTVHGKGDKIAGLNFKLDFLEELVIYKIPYDLEISVSRSTIVKKVAAQKLVFIPNGVDINSFKTAVRNRKYLKKLLYVGRLSPEKGVDLLIEAFRLAKIKGKLDIVGEGSEMSTLKTKVNKLPIKFWGKVEGFRLRQIYKDADLLILPSRTEGHPLTLFEAWAAKLPVLVTDVGDNSKYVKNNKTGFICQPTVQSIADALINIRTKELTQIGEYEYNRVKNFDWEKISNLTDKAYRTLYEH